MSNGPICLLKGAKEWISNYQVTSEDGYFDCSVVTINHIAFMFKNQKVTIIQIVIVY